MRVNVPRRKTGKFRMTTLSWLFAMGGEMSDNRAWTPCLWKLVCFGVNGGFQGFEIHQLQHWCVLEIRHFNCGFGSKKKADLVTLTPPNEWNDFDEIGSVFMFFLSTLSRHGVVDICAKGVERWDMMRYEVWDDEIWGIGWWLQGCDDLIWLWCMMMHEWWIWCLKSSIFRFWNTPVMGLVCWANPPLIMADLVKKKGRFKMADLVTLIRPIIDKTLKILQY